MLLLSLVLLGSGHRPAADLELGKKIYFKRCKVCHGVRGNSNAFAASVLNPPPRNFTGEQSLKELTPERMIRSVTRGRAGTAMMPWKDILTADEIQAVVYYISRTFMGLAAPAGEVKR
ncbi:MAG: cytochrome c [Nitrospinota bacterium]|nr:cytochrome c [Nitrospinota bacterium]